MLTACLEVSQAAVCVCVEPEMLLTSAPITMKTRRRVACGGLWGERAAYLLPCAAKFLNFSLLIYFSPPPLFCMWSIPPDEAEVTGWRWWWWKHLQIGGEKRRSLFRDGCLYSNRARLGFN